VEITWIAVLTEAASFGTGKTASAGSGGVSGRREKSSCRDALEGAMAAERGIRYCCLRWPMVKMAFSEDVKKNNPTPPTGADLRKDLGFRW
jgi:hypothetical protein